MSSKTPNRTDKSINIVPAVFSVLIFSVEAPKFALWSPILAPEGPEISSLGPPSLNFFAAFEGGFLAQKC
jgi:hypothetical protein